MEIASFSSEQTLKVLAAFLSLMLVRMNRNRSD
jgi:hypothetical protein